MRTATSIATPTTSGSRLARAAPRSADVLRERLAGRGAVKRLAGSSDRAPKAVILDLGPNSKLDITSSENLEELVNALRSAGSTSPLPRSGNPSRDAAARRSPRVIGEDHVFHTIDEAVHKLGPDG